MALPREAIVGAAFVMGALMIAPVRMFALKFHGFGWRGNELRWSFVGVALAGLCLFGVRAVPAIILLYIVASTVRWLLLRGRLRSCRRIAGATDRFTFMAYGVSDEK